MAQTKASASDADVVKHTVAQDTEADGELLDFAKAAAVDGFLTLGDAKELSEAVFACANGPSDAHWNALERIMSEYRFEPVADVFLQAVLRTGKRLQEMPSNRQRESPNDKVADSKPPCRPKALKTTKRKTWQQRQIGAWKERSRRLDAEHRREEAVKELSRKVSSRLEEDNADACGQAEPTTVSRRVTRSMTASAAASPVGKGSAVKANAKKGSRRKGAIKPRKRQQARGETRRPRRRARSSSGEAHGGRTTAKQVIIVPNRDDRARRRTAVREAMQNGLRVPTEDVDDKKEKDANSKTKHDPDDKAKDEPDDEPKEDPVAGKRKAEGVQADEPISTKRVTRSAARRLNAPPEAKTEATVSEDAPPNRRRRSTTATTTATGPAQRFAKAFAHAPSISIDESSQVVDGPPRPMSWPGSFGTAKKLRCKTPAVSVGGHPLSPLAYSGGHHRLAPMPLPSLPPRFQPLPAAIMKNPALGRSPRARAIVAAAASQRSPYGGGVATTSGRRSSLRMDSLAAASGRRTSSPRLKPSPGAASSSKRASPAAAPGTAWKSKEAGPVL